MWDYQEARDYENLKQTWKACEELGLSFYDTAEIYGYGESERIIGKLLKDSSDKYRKEVTIATKCESRHCHATTPLSPLPVRA